MKKLLSVLVAFTLIFSFVPSAVMADTGIATQADLLTSEYGVASVQYALMRDGEIVYEGASGYSSRTSETVADSDTVYGIGSTSKVFTTVVALMLVEDGLIELDKPVVDYIPEFKMADSRYTDITVRMLLNHSSGLMGSTYSSGFLWDDSDTRAHDTLLDDLKTQRLKADPGAYSVYCNDGFTLAEILCEKVSGKTFSALVSEMIAKPLGMTSTSTPSDGIPEELARVYSSYNPEREMTSEATNVIGTGGVYSTAADLCLLGTLFTGGSELLSDEMAEASMKKEYLGGQWLEDGSNIIGYGLGWDSVELYPFDLYDIQAVAKGGDTMNFHCSLIVLPEYDMVAAVTSSGGSSLYNQLLATNMLLAQLLEDSDIDEIIADVELEAPVAAKNADDMSDYEGVYASFMALFTLAFNEDGDMELAGAYAPDTVQTFVHVGDGVYMDETGAAEIYFVRQNDINYLCQNTYTTLPGIGQVYMREYVAQQLEDNELPEDAQAAWAGRNGMSYLVVSEKYSSQVYSEMLPAANVLVSELAPGYLAGSKITGPNKAETVLQIPLTAGRDIGDYTFTSENGVEYLMVGDNKYISIMGIESIYTGESSICTIQQSGYARWYMISESLNGKTISVDMPENCGFVVYDANGMATYSSVIEGGSETTLSTFGFIVFIGDSGTQFNITIK